MNVLNKKVTITNLKTSNIKILNKDKCIELLKKYKNGDNFVKEQIILGNLKLILTVIKKINIPSNIDSDDLFQIGCIGLIKAIDNFDLDHEVRFSTYAVPMILGEIKRYLRDNNSVRISRSIKDMAFKALKTKEKLINKNGKEPTVEEIAKEMGVCEFEVSHALTSLKDTVSMFEPIYNDGGDVIYLSDQLCNEENLYGLDEKIALKNALNKLKPKEKYILVERYLVGKTQMELALEIGISQAQISRLEKNGLSNLKKMID